MLLMKTVLRSTTMALIAISMLAPACAGAPADDLGEGAVTAQSAEVEYLYGLSRAELAQLHPVVKDRYDLEAWLDANVAPFDCGRYGTMCQDVGEEAAYTITEASYRMGLEGASLDEIDAYLSGALDEATRAWEAREDERGEDERADRSCFFSGGANEERLKVTAYAHKPLLGNWNTHASCTYQVKGLFGIWFEESGASLQACNRGELRDDGTVVDRNPNSGVDCHGGAGGTVDSDTLLYFPSTPTLTLASFARCSASKGGWSAAGSCSVAND